MKEIVLDINKICALKNDYNHLIKIGRGKLGYYIITENNKIGPFNKLALDKKLDLIIICYSNECIKTYSIMENGLFLTATESLIGEKDLEIEGCSLIGKINGYFIFISEDDGKILSINNKDNNEQLKFDTYEDLIDYYNKLNISLNNKDISSILLKRRKLFIKVEDLINIVANINISNIDEDILFDIAANRVYYKKLYTSNKDKLIKTSYSDTLSNKLINDGYIEIKNTSFDSLEKQFSEHIQKYIELANTKEKLLKEDAINYLKKASNIDFSKLIKEIDTLSISDLSSKAQAEISSKRPLTTQIFSSILSSVIDKHGNISDQYKNTTNFKAIYPEEYEILLEKSKEKLPVLYKEYYENFSAKINKLLSK